MTLVTIILLCAACLAVAYRVYGRLLARLLRLDPDAPTPAVAMRDDIDYAPIQTKFLMSQHFSAIAAAGPIVGPILAGVMFGWLPALLWILVGSIFIGGVHDMTTLVASIRHKARSIAEVVREHMSRRSYVLFLLFVWIALVYIIVAFTDIVAASFVGSTVLENGEVVTGGGIATSSMLYLAIPVIMGLLLRFTRLSLNVATLIFLPLVGVAIWVGQFIPLDLAPLLSTLGMQDLNPTRAWGMLLLAYCFVASIVPLWMLLQPRGHLGGYFLYAALLGGVAGLLFGGHEIKYPAFTGWTSATGDPIAPVLFITIACGACSGFHCLIASGTTSKQLSKETDAKPIGYGAMLLEAMVAIVSLSCVMILAPDAAVLKRTPTPANLIYGEGIGTYLKIFGIPAKLAVSFGLLAFTTFVYDTLDVCTRLGRYILQELTGLAGAGGRVFGTALTAGVPLLLLNRAMVDPVTGTPLPAWRVFWPLFGASNQLLAALALIGITVWLWRTRHAKWVWPVAGIPAAWMYVMSVWALLQIVQRHLTYGLTLDPVPWVSLTLVGLAVLMLAEAIWVFVGPRPPTYGEPSGFPVAAASGN